MNDIQKLQKLDHQIQLAFSVYNQMQMNARRGRKEATKKAAQSATVMANVLERGRNVRTNEVVMSQQSYEPATEEIRDQLIAQALELKARLSKWNDRTGSACRFGGISGAMQFSFRRFPMYSNHVSQGFPHRGWRLKNSYVYDNGKQLKALHGPSAKY